MSSNMIPLKEDIKRPKITKGKWQINNEGVVYHWGNGPETEGYRPCIAKVSLWKDNRKEAEANGRAVVEIPNMVDTLIKCYKTLNRIPDEVFETDGDGHGRTWPYNHTLLMEIKVIMANINK